MQVINRDIPNENISLEINTSNSNFMAENEKELLLLTESLKELKKNLDAISEIDQPEINNPIPYVDTHQ